MILDTTILVDLMRGSKDAEEKIRALLTAGKTTTVTAPSVFELFSGVSQCSKPAQECERIHRILQDQVHWELDEVSAERGGLLHGELIKQGKEIAMADAMIAGIALQHNEPVLTRNVKHFSRVPSLKVETY